MKIVLQDGIKDCGVCSLLSVIRFYGGDVSKEYLRELTNTTKNGVSAYNLIEAAKKIVNANKVSDNDINNAVKSFNNWFNIWSVHNDFSTNQTPTITNNVIEEAPVMDEVIGSIVSICKEKNLGYRLLN